MDEQKTHTPPPVKGYRKLTQQEVDLVNLIKSAEAAFAAVWHKVKQTPGVDMRMVALARTNAEDATMWLSRSVFQPSSPFDSIEAMMELSKAATENSD